MMNEAHSGLQRCIRTRQIGKQILPVAHQAGVRHLAIEALFPAFAEHGNRTRQLLQGDFGYLSQPEMRDFIQTALDLGWTLVPYEADSFKWISEKHGIDLSNSDPDEKYRRGQEFQSEFTTLEYTNWREEQQALNIIHALKSLPTNTPLLVWCGNGHNSKLAIEDWKPMGYCFQQFSTIDPFVIDQIRTVEFEFRDNELETELMRRFSDEFSKHGGAAGFLREEVAATLAHYQMFGVDAFLLSTHNKLQ